MSIIYYSDVARIIAKYEALSNVMNQFISPESGGTKFIPALEKIQEILKNQPNDIKFLKSVVLFLTDG